MVISFGCNVLRYIIHWKERLSNAPITDFCVGFVMEDVPDPEACTMTRNKKACQINNSSRGSDKVNEAATKVEVKDKPIYYMLTPALQEDKQLRTKIWNDRLVWNKRIFEYLTIS
jgi:hypothetical protein